LSHFDIMLYASSISFFDSTFKISYLLKLLFLFIKNCEYFQFETSDSADMY